MKLTRAVILKSNAQTARFRPAGSAFAVLAVFCLNLLVPLCAAAMAEIGGDHDCPHCPPSHTEEHAVHRPGHESAGHHADAGLEAPSTAMPCASAASDCGMLDVANVDIRQFGPALEDMPQDSPDTLPCGINAVDLRGEPMDGRPYASRSPPATPNTPLNLLHCIWLI